MEQQSLTGLEKAEIFLNTVKPNVLKEMQSMEKSESKGFLTQRIEH